MLSRVVLLSILAAAAHAANIPVAVGGPNLLTFNPSNVIANPGDTIEFVFHEKNHTATQSSFGAPCTPLNGGFDSGFNPVPPGTMADFPSYTITINDTKPVWVHCKQQGPPVHCQKGMVFSANAATTGSNTFAAFQAAAIALGGGASSATSSDAAASTTDTAMAYTPPPSPVTETVTATVTVANSVYTTTYESVSGAPANPTPAAQPAIHTVDVGKDGLTFTPSTVNASIGDMVTFTFHPKNHSVTRSTFNNPCAPMPGGFDSGLTPVSPNATDFPTFNITVNDTKPIWIYCKQPGPPPHCQQGMVMGINVAPDGPTGFPAYLALAEHSNFTNSSSGSGSGSGSGTAAPSATSSSSGAGRAAITVSLGMSITAFAVAALL